MFGRRGQGVGEGRTREGCEGVRSKREGRVRGGGGVVGGAGVNQ